MNTNYLYSVLNLYLHKESKKRVTLTINRNNNYIFAFSMDDSDDVTKIVLSDEEVTIELIEDIIKTIKGDYIDIDDSYEYNEEKNICKYEAMLNNGRKIIFKNFTLEEVNLFRNIIYNLSVDDRELKIDLDDKEKEIPYNLRLKQAGFSTYVTIFLVLIWTADIIVIILWIFKHLSK